MRNHWKAPAFRLRAAMWEDRAALFLRMPHSAQARCRSFDTFSCTSARRKHDSRFETASAWSVIVEIMRLPTCIDDALYHLILGRYAALNPPWTRPPAGIGLPSDHIEGAHPSFVKRQPFASASQVLSSLRRRRFECKGKLRRTTAPF